MLRGISMTMPREEVWFLNVRDLVRYPSRFWPTRDQTPGGQINALVRLFVYVTVAVYAYNRNPKILYLGLGAITIVSASYTKAAGRDSVAALASLATRGQCRRPTRENPFMNRLLTDPVAGVEPCEYTGVKKDVQTYFNTGLPRDIEDVYEKMNSQRQFVPMPNGGVPPDSRQFAQFLYGDMRNCKTFASECRGTR